VSLRFKEVPGIFFYMRNGKRSKGIEEIEKGVLGHFLEWSVGTTDVYSRAPSEHSRKLPMAFRFSGSSKQSFSFHSRPAA